MSEDASPRLIAALEGSYSIERRLGEGGTATVYLAEDLKHQRKVALKVLKPELAAVIGGERFVTEIRTTANLQHPHILALFDSGEAGGFLYYVPPFPVEQSYPDTVAGRPMKHYVDWIAPTFVLSLTGLPVASAPCGLDAEGLPVGLQILGPPCGEESVLALARLVHERHPLGEPPLDR